MSHYYIDTRNRERKPLPNDHVKHELEILPVIAHTFLLLDCKELNKEEPQLTNNYQFYDSNFTADDIPF